MPRLSFRLKFDTKLNNDLIKPFKSNQFFFFYKFREREKDLIINIRQNSQQSVQQSSQQYLQKQANCQTLQQFPSMIFSNGSLSGVSASQNKYISSFHLVVWLFAVSSPISDDQYRRIRKMYGEKHEMITVVIRKRSELQNTMKDIQACNNHCMVKILLDEVMYPTLIDLCQKEERILEICLWDKTQSFNIEKPPAQSNLKPISVAMTFDEVLNRAETQVQKWTKSYKTFQNTHILTHDFDKINRFRFILISFINMRVSDFQGAFKQFKQFAQNEVMSLQIHLTNMLKTDKTNTLITKVRDQLGEFGEYRLNALKFQKAVTQSQRQEFYNYVMKLYQKDTFFYHIFNSNLRMIGQTGFNRKQLMLPFSHVYNSIKWLYLNQVKKKNPFYLKPFTAYRAQRSKISFINNLRKKLKQMRQLDEKQKKVIKDHINTETYGPFSTTLSAKIAVDKFSFYPQYKQRQEKKDRGIEENQTSQSSCAQEQYEIHILNRYKFSHNPRLHEVGNEHFLHGFFKMTSIQSQRGLAQQQVFVNSFNVFRVTDIRQMKIIDLFTEEELEIQRKQEKNNKTQAQSVYKVTSIKSRFYQQTIIVIDYEFGPFYDEVLLEKNQYNLGPYETKARQSYIYCINKIRKYNKFDYSDACFVLNELDQCYRVLKEKTANSFQLSKQDGKNYFEQISKICRMLGRVTEAKKYTNLAIQCHKQLQQVHLTGVYNTHYEKLYDMQMSAIEFYRECADLMDAQEGLNKALQLIKSKHFNPPDVKLRESEVIMNIGINYYSRGKLDESREKFEQCRKQLLKLLDICNLEPQLSCYFCSYLKNIFCKDQDKEKRYCSYDKYGNKLREIIIAEKIRQYGSQQQLRKNSKMAQQMIQLTNDAVKNREQYFMKKDKYQQLIWNVSESSKVQSKMQQDLDKQIKECTTKMARYQTQSKQYQELSEELENLKKRLKKMEVSSFEEPGAETYINEYIKKFTQREQNRRLTQLQKKKDQFKTARYQTLVQQYIRCAEDIMKNIKELKADGFVDQANDIIAQRKKLADIWHKSQQRQYALEQIDMILKLKLAEGQTRYYQYATACLTKGKILFEVYQFKEAIESFQASIQYFNSFWNTQLERAKDLNKEQKNHKESDHNNEYQLAMMMKVKVGLKKMEDEQSRQGRIIDKDMKLRKFQKEILELQKIVQKRNQKEELSIRQLKCNLLQIKIYYWTKLPHCLANQQRIFQYLHQLVKLNKLYEGEDSLKNILLLCDLVISYHRNDNFMAKFLQFQYDVQLQKARIECQNPSIQWIIARALYYIYNFKSKPGFPSEDLRKAQHYIAHSLQLLSKLSQDSNKRHLMRDFDDLEREHKALSRVISNKMNSQVGTTLSTNPYRSRQNQISSNQINPITQTQQYSRNELDRERR